ncbi:alpha/beta hydrolase family protein [Murinocardiopsis flavida]|uniref:Alpha/beta hydrolase family protein n=1 Tax=Murinocardiopsis flavida TaxID=645275 RepID=A0A2P8CDJ9_9ACTN|nr:alpha/beta fold hydrolase [Murinocardiopsis flavida]PSK83068.1 alpha/beta hydrolase family protein [Murinocardiopsis flavida]
MSQQPTYVFVHGTHSNAHHWTWTMQELALRGRRTLAVDLPGHGVDAYIPESYQRQDLAAMATEPSPLAKLTADDYADHVESVVTRAHANGPVVLVGHSQGGVSLSLTANRIPERIQRLVYISAFCCIDKPTMVDYMSIPELLTEEAMQVMNLPFIVGGDQQGVSRMNWRSADPRFEEAFRRLNAHTSSIEQSRALHQMVQPDEPTAVTVADARGHADTWGTVPRSYIRLTEDRFLPPVMQDRFIAEADRLTPDNPFDVHSVASPHFLPQSQELVAILDGLGER